MNSFILYLSSFVYNFLNRLPQTELDDNQSLPFHVYHFMYMYVCSSHRDY